MKKVAFITQRYGNEVLGGAENFTRWIAEHMSKYWEVTILTTCSKDHVVWDSFYPPGEDCVNGIRIKRFKLDEARDFDNYNRLTKKMITEECSPEIQEEWMRKQGPLSTDLFKYVAKNKGKYDFFVLFGFAWASTYFTISEISKKSFILPFAHDEPSLYFDLFENVFDPVAGISFNTPEEKELVNRVYPKTIKTPSAIISVGIDIPTKIETGSFLKKYKITDPYMIYLGRIGPEKGCPELFANFIRFKQKDRGGAKLLVLGSGAMPVPRHSDIIYLGPIFGREKFEAIAGCEFLINPSPFESFSLILAEAWLLKKPVLVNGKTAVLKGQVLRSNGGLWYETYPEFTEACQILFKDKALVKKMGENGKKYVEYNYNWELIEEKYVKFATMLFGS